MDYFDSYCLFWDKLSLLFRTRQEKQIQIFFGRRNIVYFPYLINFLGFSFYIQNFSRYNAVYGSIGTVLILMFYLWLNSMILLIGFELNASIRQARMNKGMRDS